MFKLDIISWQINCIYLYIGKGYGHVGKFEKFIIREIEQVSIIYAIGTDFEHLVTALNQN